MKRILRAAAAVILAAGPAAAQTVPLRVGAGDVYTVSFEQTQKSGLVGEDMEVTVRQVLSLEIVDAEKGVWRYTPISLSTDAPEASAIGQAASIVNQPAYHEAVSAMLRLGTDIGFECRVDEFGRCLELTNWPM